MTNVEDDIRSNPARYLARLQAFSKMTTELVAEIKERIKYPPDRKALFDIIKRSYPDESTDPICESGGQPTGDARG